MESNEKENDRCAECGAEIDGPRWFCGACGKLVPLNEEAHSMSPGAIVKGKKARGRIRLNKSYVPGSPGEGEKAEHRGFQKSLVVRILITLLILALLIATLVLVASLRRGSREKTLRPRPAPLAADIRFEPVSPAGLEELPDDTAPRGDPPEVLPGLRSWDGAA
jgi:hypothetical protein